MDFNSAKKKIATLWFALAGILFLLMLLQTFSGKYEDKVSDAWGWVFPNVVPTLSLMIGVFLADFQSNKISKRSIDVFYFKLSIGLSVFYLISLFLVIFLQPLFGKPIIFVMQESNLYLGPFQGLVNASMGLFFFKQQNEE